MALVVQHQTQTDRLLAAIAAAPAVASELGGSVELPPLPASRSIDQHPQQPQQPHPSSAASSPVAADAAAAADLSADFSASHWSTTLPRGYRLCRRRASSPYDADVQEFFEQYAQIEEEYAQKLQRLGERLTREPEAGGLSLFGPKPLARTVQYASAQHGWAAVQQAVRSHAQAHRGFATELRAQVVEPLKGAVAQAQAREAAELVPHAAELERVRQARVAAKEEATRYGRMLHRYRKEARKKEAQGEGAERCPEAMLLCAAAHDCAGRVAEANASTARFEVEVAPKAIDALQEHEETRLESLSLAFNAFADVAMSSGALPPVHAQSVRAAAKAISVPADVCAFASTYSGSAQRAADELVAPSFCEEIAATADQISENQGFWSAPWRLLRNLAASILGDDGRDEPQLPPPHNHNHASMLDSAREEEDAGVAAAAATVADGVAYGVAAASFGASGFGSPGVFSSAAHSPGVVPPPAAAGDASAGPPPPPPVLVTSPPPMLSPVAAAVTASSPSLRQVSPCLKHLSPRPQQPQQQQQQQHYPASPPPPVAATTAEMAADASGDAILHSVDELVMGLGGSGLTMAEAVLLQEQVLVAETPRRPNAGGAAGGVGAAAAASLLPAGHEEGEWYYVDSAGETVGPLTWVELQQDAATAAGATAATDEDGSSSSSSSSKLLPESWAFMEGMSEWVSAESLPGLFPSAAAAAMAAAAMEEEEEEDAVPPPPPPPPPPPAEEEEEDAMDVENQHGNHHNAGHHSIAPSRPSVSRDSFACFPSSSSKAPPLATLVEDDEEGIASPPPPPPMVAEEEEGGDGLLSPAIAPRSKKRKQSMRRRSSLGTLMPVVASMQQAAPPPPPPPAAPPPPPPPPPEDDDDSVTITVGGMRAPSVLQGIQGFDKSAQLRKVRRKSVAFANAASGNKGAHGMRRPSGLPPLPPSAGGSNDALAGDIANVLARAIMLRRTQSRVDVEDDDNDDANGSEHVSSLRSEDDAVWAP